MVILLHKLHAFPNFYSVYLAILLSGNVLVLINVVVQGCITICGRLTVYGHIKTAEQYNNMVVCTLAIDGWAVTFGTVRRGLGGLGPCPVPSSLYQM